MFTSRAEYRLTLRADNADQRLTERGIEAGIVGAERAAAYREKASGLAGARERLRGLKATPSALNSCGVSVNLDGEPRSAFQLLAYPGVDIARLGAMWPELAGIAKPIAHQLEIEARYAGYLVRQEADIRAFRKDEALVLSAELDYGAIGSLSTEIREKLMRVRPETLGAAARIPGMTPAALTALLRYVQHSDRAA